MVERLWRARVVSELSAAVLLLVAISGPASAGQAWRLGPDHHSLRHPANLTIRIFATSSGLPTLRFFVAASLRGTPAAVLDAKGLWVDGQLRCPWVPWADGERLLRRGATYTNSDFHACSAGVAVSTVVTDAGFGSPQVRLVIRGVKGRIAELDGVHRPLFFDLTTLPGGAGTEFQPAGVTLPHRETTGWEWDESQHAVDVREGEALAQRLREPAFARFYHGLRRCLTGDGAACLTSYLAPAFVFDNGEPGGVPRAAFSRYARKTHSEEFGSLWEEIAWCVLRGRVHVEGERVSFHRKLLVCDAVRSGDGYAVSECWWSD